jgi:4-O-beta-D-mannosyl-D-glucose phosphorylase
MKNKEFEQRLTVLNKKHNKLIIRPNKVIKGGNGIYERYKYPVVTAAHTPLFWRYNMNPVNNPFLMERMGINATLNSGAIEMDNKILLAVRVEGWDRKSFIAVAESSNGIDHFKFWDYPVVIPETDDPETNIYDMRLTQHQDGWIYGVFCAEKKNPKAPPGDLSSAIAQCGIARTKDLLTWQRFDDLKTPSPQQRNCVLHPDFVDGKYAFYTRPQDDFIQAGSGGGIGWGLAEDIEHAVIDTEEIIDHRAYHTIKELKNGQGPAPLKTPEGWLHLAHGVRACAAGLRYVLYVFLTDLENPARMIKQPGGYFIAPEGIERVGDVSNVVFANGWVMRQDGTIFIYYGSSDTRMHVATTSMDRLLDYVMNTPEDGLRSAVCVEQRISLIQKNLKYLKGE